MQGYISIYIINKRAVAIGSSIEHGVNPRRFEYEESPENFETQFKILKMTKPSLSNARVVFNALKALHLVDGEVSTTLETSQKRYLVLSGIKDEVAIGAFLSSDPADTIIGCSFSNFVVSFKTNDFFNDLRNVEKEVDNLNELVDNGKIDSKRLFHKLTYKYDNYFPVVYKNFDETSLFEYEKEFMSTLEYETLYTSDKLREMLVSYTLEKGNVHLKDLERTCIFRDTLRDKAIKIDLVTEGEKQLIDLHQFYGTDIFLSTNSVFRTKHDLECLPEKSDEEFKMFVRGYGVEYGKYENFISDFELYLKQTDKCIIHALNVQLIDCNDFMYTIHVNGTKYMKVE
ncbi:hypothetical protein D3C87_853130 [compost metagenome]